MEGQLSFSIHPKNTSKKSKKDANVELIELDSSDIQRSPIVSQILEIYNSDGKSNEYNEVNNIISSIDHFTNNNIEKRVIDSNQDAAMLPKDSPRRRDVHTCGADLMPPSHVT